MTDPTGPPPSGADWVAEVDDHLADGHDHIDIAQAAVDVDQATTDRTQATADRDQATTDRDQATTDRDQAITDRTQATRDRHEHREMDRVSRNDVATLARSVAELAASVAGLPDLILATAEKADRAQTEAAKSPSRCRVYWITIGVIALVFALAGTGAFVVHRQQAQNYTACQERNAAQDQSDAFLGKIDKAVQKSRPTSTLARNLGNIITPVARKTVACHRPLP